MPVNYDRAVSYYDATRGYRDGVVERYREAPDDLVEREMLFRTVIARW